jgi:sugar lactone lactonase YvrE
VDIAEAKTFRLDLDTGKVAEWVLQEALTAFAPTSDGRFIGAFLSGLAYMDGEGKRGAWLQQPEAGLTGNRFNDGGTDPRGRFLAGTMNEAGASDSGALYSFEAPNRIRVLRKGICISNTVAFSPDGRLLYTADTAKNRLDAFVYDPDSGQIVEKDHGFRPSGNLPGLPDGSAVDEEGFLWNARWGGGCLVRLAPDGSLDRRIDLPVSQPTSCAFVGADLYITTAAWELDEAARRAEPLAGGLLRIETGVCGVPRPEFGGE